MGIMNAPMMLTASSGDDVDFMVHGLIPLKFFGHKVWITTTHVTTLRGFLSCPAQRWRCFPILTLGRISFIATIGRRRWCPYI